MDIVLRDGRLVRRLWLLSTKLQLASNALEGRRLAISFVREAKNVMQTNLKVEVFTVRDDGVDAMEILTMMTRTSNT